MHDMDNVIPIYKYLGETPLACIERFKAAFPVYTDLPMTYAGRLDPMAEGLLILLSGEKCKEKEQYLGFDKVYFVDFVLGIATDSYDVLGLITDEAQVAEDAALRLPEILPTFIGKQNQMYPPYSSKTVAGKPLFAYARERKLDTITIPSHPIEIYEIVILESSLISESKVAEKAIEKIQNIQGDFRQSESIAVWEARLTNKRELPTFSIKIRASSGTYVRQLVQDIARKLGTSAVVTGIYRPEIGDFSLKYKA